MPYVPEGIRMNDDLEIQKRIINSNETQVKLLTNNALNLCSDYNLKAHRLGATLLSLEDHFSLASVSFISLKKLLDSLNSEYRSPFTSCNNTLSHSDK